MWRFQLSLFELNVYLGYDMYLVTSLEMYLAIVFDA